MSQFLNFGDYHDGDADLSGTESYTALDATATSGSRTVTGGVSLGGSFPAGTMVFLYSGVTGDWEQNFVASVTNSTQIELVNACDNDYDYIRKVKEYNNVIIQDGDTFIVGYRTFICAKSFVIKGVLSGDPYSSANVEYDGGNETNARAGTAPDAFAGLGTGGVDPTPRQTTANGGGGGGGGSTGAGDGGAGGGGGGNATAGTNGGAGQGTAGQGGLEQGDTALTTIGGGGGGGGCGESNKDNGGDGGPGGRGSGFCIIFAERFIIESTGSVSFTGENGWDASGSSPSEGGGGGGGGCGGSLLVKSKYMDINTNKIVAPGGTGGQGNGTQGGDGGNGSAGRVRLEACELSGSSTNPTPSTSIGGQSWCFLTPQIY